MSRQGRNIPGKKSPGKKSGGSARLLVKGMILEPADMLDMAMDIFLYGLKTSCTLPLTGGPDTACQSPEPPLSEKEPGKDIPPTTRKGLLSRRTLPFEGPAVSSLEQGSLFSRKKPDPKKKPATPDKEKLPEETRDSKNVNNEATSESGAGQDSFILHELEDLEDDAQAQKATEKILKTPADTLPPPVEVPAIPVTPQVKDPLEDLEPLDMDETDVSFLAPDESPEPYEPPDSYESSQLSLPSESEQKTEEIPQEESPGETPVVSKKPLPEKTSSGTTPEDGITPSGNLRKFGIAPRRVDARKIVAEKIKPRQKKDSPAKNTEATSPQEVEIPVPRASGLSFADLMAEIEEEDSTATDLPHDSGLLDGYEDIARKSLEKKAAIKSSEKTQAGEKPPEAELVSPEQEIASWERPTILEVEDIFEDEEKTGISVKMGQGKESSPLPEDIKMAIRQRINKKKGFPIRTGDAEPLEENIIPATSFVKSVEVYESGEPQSTRHEPGPTNLIEPEKSTQTKKPGGFINFVKSLKSGAFLRSITDSTHRDSPVPEPPLSQQEIPQAPVVIKTPTIRGHEEKISPESLEPLTVEPAEISPEEASVGDISQTEPEPPASSEAFIDLDSSFDMPMPEEEESGILDSLVVDRSQIIGLEEEKKKASVFIPSKDTPITDDIPVIEEESPLASAPPPSDFLERPDEEFYEIYAESLITSAQAPRPEEMPEISGDIPHEEEPHLTSHLETELEFDLDTTQDDELDVPADEADTPEEFQDQPEEEAPELPPELEFEDEDWPADEIDDEMDTPGGTAGFQDKDLSEESELPLYTEPELPQADFESMGTFSPDDWMDIMEGKGLSMTEPEMEPPSQDIIEGEAFLKGDVDYQEKHLVPSRQEPRKKIRTEPAREGLKKREEFTKARLTHHKKFKRTAKNPARLCSTHGKKELADRCIECGAPGASVMAQLCLDCASNKKTAFNCIQCGRPNSRAIARYCRNCAPGLSRVCVKCGQSLMK